MMDETRIVNQPPATPPADPPRKLTLKESLFVTEYMKNGGNGTQAALKVYDTDDYYAAGAIASQNLKKIQIKEALAAYRQSILDKLNLNLETAVQPIAMALNATTEAEVRDDKGNKKIVVVPDVGMRLKGSDRAMKLLGLDISEDSKGNTYTFIQLLAEDSNGFAT